MRQVDFAILILTYNRPELVRHTLQSLAAQSYKAFHVRLVDNGSMPAIDPHSLPQLADLEVIRLESNRHPCDVAEQYWPGIPGTHFLWLGDDDALVPDALERVAAFLTSNPTAEFVFGGFAHFDHEARRPSLNSKTFSSSVSAYDALSLALGYCSAWNINAQGTPPPRSHPSTTFICRRLLNRTVAIQGRLFVLPLGDVGFLGALACTSNAYYLNQPLAVIGISSTQDSRGMTRGRRKHWSRDVGNIRHSPVKSLSFANIAVESHLKVALPHRLIALDKVPCRPDFFRAHLAQILTDTPLDSVTLSDAHEAVKPAWSSLQTYPGRRLKEWRRNLKLKMALRVIAAAATTFQPPSEVLTSTQVRLLRIAGWLVGASRVSSDVRPVPSESSELFVNIAEYARSLKNSKP